MAAKGKSDMPPPSPSGGIGPPATGCRQVAQHGQRQFRDNLLTGPYQPVLRRQFDCIGRTHGAYQHIAWHRGGPVPGRKVSDD
jgi:hypothetical protein